MCWSSESFGSAIEPSKSDSMAFIVSFNRRLTRTCFRGRPCSPNRSHHGFIFRRVGSAAFRIAGIKVVSSHNLRKTFATRLLSRGAGITDVQHLLGHASVTTTEKAYAAFVKNERFKQWEFRPKRLPSRRTADLNCYVTCN